MAPQLIESLFQGRTLPDRPKGVVAAEDRTLTRHKVPNVQDNDFDRGSTHRHGLPFSEGGQPRGILSATGWADYLLRLIIDQRLSKHTEEPVASG